MYKEDWARQIGCILWFSAILWGPLVLLILVNIIDIFNSFMSFGLDVLGLEGFMIAVYLVSPLFLFSLFLIVVGKLIEYICNKYENKKKTP
ncbi:hypothetical protein CN498_19610 [Bacillus thuringiensis]|uniref:hypothetical protein n=1 Tax=Bacillus thuringiensis TaxID=1428 RepID=UPI000BF98991|nr:hypothetical protein [Bacillus thuringiensis]PER85821.1 hypothetical protein CN498_19610 [Bacillus thuringiensis]HDR4862255.1 hypothetical protein [Bacillus cereus]HDR8494196.1 hypothetical protein [Bacillus cereus]